MSLQAPANPFLQLEAGQPIVLPPQGSWPLAVHVLEPQECAALKVAYAAGRPLLVRGEPGTGKSQLARVAAQKAGWRLVDQVVTPGLEPQDLLWTFDAVQRLADAQAGVDQEGKRIACGAMADYVSPGPMWWALNPQDATQHLQSHGGRNEGFDGPQGAVLLIDEIDKADLDLANSLLEVFGNGGFTLPWGDRRAIRCQRDAVTGAALRPLVVITTNEDRELPAAFVRRCAVLNHRMPSDASLVSWLTNKAAWHRRVERAALNTSEVKLQNLTAKHLMASPLSDEDQHVFADAAIQLVADRDLARRENLHPPGLAEYLDFVRTLESLAPQNPAEQRQMIKALSVYMFRKHREMSQQPAGGAEGPAGSTVSPA